MPVLDLFQTYYSIYYCSKKRQTTGQINPFKVKTRTTSTHIDAFFIQKVARDVNYFNKKKSLLEISSRDFLLIHLLSVYKNSTVNSPLLIASGLYTIKKCLVLTSPKSLADTVT